MNKKVIFSILLFITAAFSVFSDILPENKKKISFSFEVINIDSFGDYVFLAYPVNTSSGTPNIECFTLSANKPVYLPCKFGPAPKIYAIKKEFYNPDDYKDDNGNKKLDSIFAGDKNLIPSVNISCYGYADKSAPYNSVLERYKIESITADTLIIIPDKTVKKDKNGNIIDEFKGDVVGVPGGKGLIKYIYLGLPLIAVILIAVIIFIRKSKNKVK